jgi:glycosyltransferase involved in cell wall biosynthesis
MSKTIGNGGRAGEPGPSLKPRTSGGKAPGAEESRRMPRKKVLVSAYACNPSGSLHLHPGEDLTGWRFVEQVSRFHDVWVITHEYNREGIRAAGAGGEERRARFHFLKLPRPLDALYRVEFGQRIYYYLWQIAAWRAARRLHRKIGFDLAQHVTFGNDWIASYIGAFLPVPFIHGPVGGGQRTPRPLLREYTFGGRLSERGRNAAQWIGRRDPVRRRALRRAGAILVCNRETMARIPRKSRGKAVLFPVNGIAREDLGIRFPEARNDGTFRVFMAGRFHRLKGFAIALRAFAAFAGERPGAEMTVVGDGPEEGRLRRLIEDAGVRDRVTLKSWMSRPDLLSAMAASDVFLFPSFRDGGAAVVVEAMASSKPVVCLNSGGPGFHVQPGWGFRIPPGRPDEVVQGLARALSVLAKDRELLRAMGRAARERAEEYYLWDRHGERLLEIYRKILNDD